MYGREIDGEITTFGTTGYTYENTFVLYDRQSESIWYPYQQGELNAVSGAHAGRALPFLARPEQMPLVSWRKRHPESLVLVHID